MMWREPSPMGWRCPVYCMITQEMLDNICRYFDEKTCLPCSLFFKCKNAHRVLMDIAQRQKVRKKLGV